MIDSGTIGGQYVDDADSILSKVQADAAYETIANVGKIGDDTTALIAAKDSVAAWDNNSTFLLKAGGDVDSIKVDTLIVDDWMAIAGRRETGYKAFRATITNPDEVAEDTIIIARIDADEFPNGITILHIKLSCRPVAPADYIVDFYETTENDWSGTETIIETASAIKVASTAREGEDDGTMSNPGIAAGAYIMAVLPATDINQLQITVIYEVD